MAKWIGGYPIDLMIASQQYCEACGNRAIFTDDEIRLLGEVDGDRPDGVCMRTFIDYKHIEATFLKIS
jgi:hypothetical protein